MKIAITFLARMGVLGYLMTANTMELSAQVSTPPSYSGAINRSYVRAWSVVQPLEDAAQLTMNMPMARGVVTTEYVDGLGRSLQIVTRNGSMATNGVARDMVAAKIYDEFGRERQSYGAFSANSAGGNSSLSDGLFKLNPFEQQASFMQEQYGAQGESWFYGMSNFESSPLNRPLESFAPGNNWAGSSSQTSESLRHSVKTKYWFNTTLDSVRVWKVTDAGVGNWGSYSSPGSPWYASGLLNKLVTVDEQGKQVVEYKDKHGLVVLKKVQLTATADDGSGKGHHGWLCTYYIYDDLNRLRAVVQPRGVELLIANGWSITALSNAILNEQSFRYEYDERGRMIVKKVPGAGEVYMVYDARDRLVLTQDANMRAGSPVQWMYTLYDDLNRPLATGLWNNSSSRATHATPASTSTAYPNLSGQTYTELTRTFYDNYDWLGSHGNPLPTTRNTGDDGLLLSQDFSNFPYPESVVQSNATRGLVTGTKTLLLGTGNYVFSTNYYDAKGRLIQTMGHNITGGLDIATTQYGWQGLPLLTISKVEKQGTNSQTSVVVSRHHYDSLSRLVKTEKKLKNSLVNGNYMSLYVTVADNQYDALGQLKKKILAPTTGPGGGPLDSLTYDYNIRGWMLGMNRLYAKDVHQDNYFGFDLGYDKSQNGIIGNLSYAGPQYNGNISGTVWKSRGDGEKRKYDFTYDAANRILSADFNQYTSSSFNKSAGLDFSMSGMSYDANGNILTMNQRGWKGVASATIDSLLYSYISYSNKLLNVFDRANDVNTKLGDFRTSSLHPSVSSKNSSTTDYTYDANGNLVKDLNKDILTYGNGNGIEYNHLNLPKKITVKKNGSSNKGYIEYTYDAAGNKLRKTVYEPGVDTTVTLYLGGSVYRNDTLEFIGHEEGRMRFAVAQGSKPAAFHFDYMLKDHLGNVRMLLTTQKDTSFYPAATLETASLATQRLYYGGVDTGRVNKSTVSGYPTDTHSSPNDFTQKLNGNGPKIGTNMVLKVMAGDRVNIFVKSWYKKNGATPGTPVNPFNSLLNVLEPAIAGVTSTHGGATLNQLQTGNNLDPGITSFLSSQSGYTTSKPKAFVNWILFDEQFKLVSSSSGFEQVGNDNTLTTHTPSTINMGKNGFLYIYVSNETPNIDVFFDNLTVTHTRGPILEETHYYPFGLTMAGISSKALAFGSPENKAKFNGIEQNLDFDLGIYDAFYRNLDPQVGRFWQMDPKPNEVVSPYAAMLNNPIKYSDPLGDTTWLYNQNGAFLGVINNKNSKNQVHFIETDGDPGQVVDFDQLSKKDRKAYERRFREVSFAFIGSNTAANMRSIAKKSVDAGVEIGFVGAIGKDKEIRLTALPIDDGNKDNQVPIGRQINENYTPAQQLDLVLEGHTHIKAYLEALKDPKLMKLYRKNGLPNQSPSKPDDYTPVLNRGNGKGPAPSMVLTPFGVTIYGSGHMTPWGQPSPNNTYLNYKSFK